MKALGLMKYTFTAIGFALLIGALLAYNHTREFVAGAVQAEGEVIEVIRVETESTDRRSVVSFRPVVRFTPANAEQPIQFTDAVGKNPPAHSVGERVLVLYNPQQPSQAHINSFYSLWFMVIIFSVLGTVFALVGGALFRVHARRLQRRGE